MNPCLFLRPKLPTRLYKTLKALITDCWEHDPDNRPDFDEIVRRLNAEVCEEIWTKPEPYFSCDDNFLKNSADYDGFEEEDEEEDDENDVTRRLKSKMAEMEREISSLKDELTTERFGKSGAREETANDEV